MPNNITLEQAKAVVKEHGLRVCPPLLPSKDFNFGVCGLKITDRAVTVDDYDRWQLRRLDEDLVEKLRLALNERYEWKEKYK